MINTINNKKKIMSDNTIILVQLAYKTTVLAYYSEFKGTFVQECAKILNRVQKGQIVCVRSGDNVFFYMNEDDITYLIFTGKLYPKSAGLECLKGLKNEFHPILSGKNLNNIESNGLNKELKDKLKMKLEYYNDNPPTESDVTEKLKKELLKMKDEILEVNELVNERGDKLKNLNEKSDELLYDSKKMAVGAIKVRRNACWKKWRLILILILVLAIVAYAISCIACKSFTFEC